MDGVGRCFLSAHITSEELCHAEVVKLKPFLPEKTFGLTPDTFYVLRRNFCRVFFDGAEKRGSYFNNASFVYFRVNLRVGKKGHVK